MYVYHNHWYVPVVFVSLCLIHVSDNYNFCVFLSLVQVIHNTATPSFLHNIKAAAVADYSEQDKLYDIQVVEEAAQVKIHYIIGNKREYDEWRPKSEILNK